MPVDEAAPPLRALYVYLCGSCNLHCRHCWVDPGFSADGVRDHELFPVEVLEKAVADAGPLGLRTVKLTGGEPLLHPGLGRILRFLLERGLGLQLETNGTLMDPETAGLAGAFGSRIQAAVSIDGPSPATHDEFRGMPGAFRDALRGIGFLTDAGIRPQMIATLHRGNIDSMSEMVSLAERIGCGSVKFSLVIRSGRASRGDEGLALTVPEVLNADRELEAGTVQGASIPVLLGVPMAFFGPARLLRREAVKCTVLNILGLLPGGEAAMCGIGVSVPGLVYGNLLDSTVDLIWRESPGLGLLRETIPARLEGVCAGCIHRDVCQGFCVAMNYLESGRLGSDCSFCRDADAMGLFPESRKS